jgi:hypothetical protein
VVALDSFGAGKKASALTPLQAARACHSGRRIKEARMRSTSSLGVISDAISASFTSSNVAGRCDNRGPVAGVLSRHRPIGPIREPAVGRIIESGGGGPAGVTRVSGDGPSPPP